MDLVINELSFQPSAAASDTELLRSLTRVLKAIKDRVAHLDRDKVRVRVTDAWVEPRRLPNGTTIGDARRSLDEVERALCDCFFTDYPSFPVDHPAVCYFLDEPAHGLGHARRHNLLAASLPIGSHAADELTVESRGAVVSTSTVPNAWRPELTRRHVETMRAHVQVLPGYEDPGHHDPASVHYRTGKSHIPRGARELFKNARSDDNGSWWTKCECNSYHRFQGGDPVHWNGTTSPRALQQTPERDVPAVVKRYWRNVAGISDCGCR